MQDASPLMSIAIVERDAENEAMVAWSFPITTEDQDAMLVARTNFSESAVVHRMGKQWYYGSTVEGSLSSGATGVSVQVGTREWHPERWLALSSELLRVYQSGCDPLEVLRSWQRAFREGGVGDWKYEGFEDGSAYVGGGRLAGVARMLGDHLVLSWIALLLRRRVMVLAPRASDVLAAIRGLMLMVPHRGRAEWDHVRPLVSGACLSGGVGGDRPWDAVELADAEDLSTEERGRRQAGRAELKDLASAGWFVAGTTDEAWKGRPDLWDCLVDLPNGRIEPSPAAAAAGTFALTPLHRRVATAAATALREDGSDRAVATAVATVTKEILTKIKTVAEGAPRHVLTPTALAEAGIVEPMLTVLWEVAKADSTVPTATLAVALAEEDDDEPDAEEDEEA